MVSKYLEQPDRFPIHIFFVGITLVLLFGSFFATAKTASAQKLDDPAEEYVSRVYRYFQGYAMQSVRGQILHGPGRNEAEMKRDPDLSDPFRRYRIWVVDGASIRTFRYPEFVYGGNSERYPWIPTNEIWIDHAISAEEYTYTVAHELYERELMAKRGLSYAEAHDSALMLEHRMRDKDRALALEHEASLPLVGTMDCDSVRELPLPDSIHLEGIYKIYLGIKDGMQIWVVDGATVRHNIYPDFGFSGNDQTYFFIPKGEIWIDNAISCEETELSLVCELELRDRMSKGETYDVAYASAIKHSQAYRALLERLEMRRPELDLRGPADRNDGTHSEKGEANIPR